MSCKLIAVSSSNKTDARTEIVKMKMEEIMRFKWVVFSERVECFLDGYKVFSDSYDHWKNAICRLLGIDDKTARAWVENCYQDGNIKSAYESLITSTRCFFDGGKFPVQMENDKLIYSELIDKSEEFQIIGSFQPRHASMFNTWRWLIGHSVSG
jgi:hypothetical protein